MVETKKALRVSLLSAIAVGVLVWGIPKLIGVPTWLIAGLSTFLIAFGGMIK